MHMRSNKSRRMTVLRRCFLAFYVKEKVLREIVSAIITNRIIQSTLQRRSVWVRIRSQAFTDITASWDDLELKRNFRVNRATFDIRALHLV